MKQTTCVPVAIVAFCGLCDVANADILRVDAASVATNPDGSNWDGSSTGKCFRFLQDALQAANAGDIVQIAQGSYYPDQDSVNPNGTGDRNAHFALDPERLIFGGFKGVVGYPATADEMNPSLYITVLSGDLDGDDDPNEPLDHVNRSENSHSVVIVKANAQPQNTRLEGVTIRDGHGGSQQSGFFEVGGGGIFVEFEADPTIQGCVITRCDAPIGGGIFFMGGSFDTATAVNDTRIEDNEAGIGGGMYVYTAGHVTSDPGTVLVDDCEIINNRATDIGGGGVMVALGSRIELYDTLIESNSHSSLSGSQVGGAGICAWKEGLP